MKRPVTVNNELWAFPNNHYAKHAPVKLFKLFTSEMDTLWGIQVDKQGKPLPTSQPAVTDGAACILYTDHVTGTESQGTGHDTVLPQRDCPFLLFEELLPLLS